MLRKRDNDVRETGPTHLRGDTMLKLSSTALVGATLTGWAVTGALAQANEEVLLKQPLQGLDGKEVNIVLMEVPPGFQTPSHTHPGDLFVYVLEGAVEIELESGEKLAASAGEVIYEPPDQPMVGRNASSSEGARLLIFQVGDEGKPLMVPHQR
jgi:quercetin dioxygenase-like cupin family protein